VKIEYYEEFYANKGLWLKSETDIAKIHETIWHIQIDKRVGLLSQNRINKLENIVKSYFLMQKTMNIEFQFNVKACCKTTFDSYPNWSNNTETYYTGPSTSVVICKIQDSNLFFRPKRHDRDGENRESTEVRIVISRTKHLDSFTKPLLLGEIICEFLPYIDFARTEIIISDKSVEICLFGTAK
jgi:hypothetical protein